MFGRRRPKDARVQEPPESDILCPDEVSARAEAARRQATETEDAEWIYLCRDLDKQWVVRRWTVQGEEPESKSRASRVAGEVVGEVINPLNWLP